jgi:hypothetical protein
VKLGADARRILVVQALRAFAYGLGSVLIGVTLADLGLSGVQVGLVLGALVAGTALVSVVLARFGERIGRRRWYVVLLAVMAVAGTVFSLTGSVWLLMLAALTGTVSTEVVESGPFTSLEQAMLPSAAQGHDTTRLFGTYNTIATLAGSFGALAAIVTRLTDVEPQRFLLAYPVAAAAAIAVAAGLSTTVESRRTEQAGPRRPLEKSRVGPGGRVWSSDRAQHTLANVLTTRDALAKLPDERQQPVIGRRQLRRKTKPRRANAHHDVQKASDQVIRSLLKRGPITMSQIRERETATAASIAQVERWNPRFRHNHTVACEPKSESPKRGTSHRPRIRVAELVDARVRRSGKAMSPRSDRVAAPGRADAEFTSS